MESTDTEWIASVLKGNSASFEPLVVKYNPRVFATARRYARRESEVEDIVQEVWLKAFQKLSTFRGDAPFEHWLMRMTVHTCYDFLRKHTKNLAKAASDLEAELRLVAHKLMAPLRKTRDKNAPVVCDPAKSRMLTELSQPEQGACLEEFGWSYVSPKAAEDRAVTCPGAKTYGCPDLWAPDLYGDFAGVCVNCGHHFPMEYQWVMGNVFDAGSIVDYDADIEAGNPLDYPGFEEKLEAAKKKTGLKSGCVSIDAKIEGIKLVSTVLYSAFRGGSVGAAEGEKFIRALARARRRHYPFLAYVHGTAGIRIQESLNGLIQMPRVTMAVRRYIEAGGLYVVLYDTNSYAGPVASFLGCSPYQFAVRSSNIGFAGPGVIRETTGVDIPPDYHQAHNALARLCRDASAVSRLATQ